MVASAKLSQETEERLAHIVESGEYESADELVIAALDLLEERKNPTGSMPSSKRGCSPLREAKAFSTRRSGEKRACASFLRDTKPENERTRTTLNRILVTLSPEATHDRLNILLYTLEKWGPQ